MNDNNLQDELEKPRSEIENVARHDTAAKERLTELVNEVEKGLDELSDTEIDDNMLEGIRDAITQFESEHPRATAILNDIMVTLSNMGI